jgi:hypothetical protein
VKKVATVARADGRRYAVYVNLAKPASGESRTRETERGW